MAKLQTPLIAMQLPFAGAPGRLRPNLTTARGKRGRFFEFSATKCQFVPRLKDLKKIRKLYSLLHLRTAFAPPSGRGLRIPVEAAQMKKFMSLETSDVQTPAERAIRNNAPFEAATGGTYRVSRFAPSPAAAHAHEGATKGRILRTKPTEVRWLVLHNRLWNLELGRKSKTNQHLTTWLSFTNEAIYEREVVKRGGADFVKRGSRTSPSPSASVDLALLGPGHGRSVRATRYTSSEAEGDCSPSIPAMFESWTDVT
jgi:hypothetical protein